MNEDNEMKKIREELNRLKEQLTAIDLKQIKDFGSLLKWHLTLSNFMDQLKRYVDTGFEMLPQMIKVLESYNEEIRGLRKEIKGLRKASEGITKKKT